MILTCPQCQAQYNLDPTMLGTTGRDVRCVSCSHMWFQLPDSVAGKDESFAAEEPAAAPPPAQEPPPQQSITEALNTILEKDDAAFEAVLSTVSQSAKSKEAKAAEDAAMPRSVAPKQKSIIRQDAPLVTHNPLGLGANAFGGLVFLLLSFLTLTVLFVGKNPIVRHWPQMSLFYNSLGMHVKAPGEGLRLSEITSERRTDENNVKILVVEGKLTNMTEHDIAYPTLQVILKNDHGVTKTWDIKPAGTRVASGDVVPVMLQLNEPPDDGSIVDVRVKEEK